jgi:tRNA(fMet)-specific endonuclease VapC
VERLILDTTVLISVERVRHDLGDAVGEDDDAAIAAITVAELLVGIELATARRRTRREALVRDLLEGLTVEDYTAETARAHATLLVATRRQGRPRGSHDLIIAATALATGRAVVTTDARGFADLPGVQVRLVG